MGTLKVPVTRHDHIRGPANAPVTLVEYGDYECPGCGAAHPIVKLVLKHFGRRLRFVFRHFPLTQVHPNAEPAAESAEFAGAHGLFWEMHDGIYENQDRLSLTASVCARQGFGTVRTGIARCPGEREICPEGQKRLYRRRAQRRERHAVILHQWTSAPGNLRVGGPRPGN